MQKFTIKFTGLDHEDETVGDFIFRLESLPMVLAAPCDAVGYNFAKMKTFLGQN